MNWENVQVSIQVKRAGRTFGATTQRLFHAVDQLREIKPAGDHGRLFVVSGDRDGRHGARGDRHDDRDAHGVRRDAHGARRGGHGARRGGHGDRGHGGRDDDDGRRAQ